MSARLQSVKILCRIFREKVFFNTLKQELNEKDVPFANMLVLTVLRHAVFLEDILRNYIVKKMPGKQTTLGGILLCAAAELLFMETPDYAVINEYVALTRKFDGRYAAGMVNAVLRKIAANKTVWQNQPPNKVFPGNFRKLLSADYDKDSVLKMEKAALTETPLDITVAGNAEAWAEKLGGMLLANGTIRLKAPGLKIPSLPGYGEGAWWVQDLAASLPVILAGEVAGKKILDLCAAPGGKTAQLLAAGAEVTAVDIDPERLVRLKENICRLRLQEKLNTVTADGLAFLEQSQSMYDLILLDAPCSATGIFRRHPEIMHIKSIEDVKKQCKIQESLLEAAAGRLTAGGRIIYCTCSTAKAEGENRIKAFLQKHAGFEPVPFAAEALQRYKGVAIDKRVINNGVLRTLPYYMEELGGMDAFFAAAVRKKTGGI